MTSLTRRRWLQGAAVALLYPLLGAHAPYEQWVVYRKKHLLIGCHRRDARGYVLAKQVVAALAEELPAAKARVARAPRPERIASLLGTAQLDVALLSPSMAELMQTGAGLFKPYGPVRLELLGWVEDQILVARPAFRPDHAWLVTGALAHAETLRSDGAELGVPWHDGSQAYWEGRPRPSP
ncbi:MAG: hypothetical protein KTR21_05340 [Rhodobacteraceae bacterium]|nr:hypothetical protein [Paracoccaceae bacterium]